MPRMTWLQRKGLSPAINDPTRLFWPWTRFTTSFATWASAIWMMNGFAIKKAGCGWSTGPRTGRLCSGLATANFIKLVEKGDAKTVAASWTE